MIRKIFQGITFFSLLISTSYALTKSPLPCGPTPAWTVILSDSEESHNFFPDSIYLLIELIRKIIL